MRTLASSFADPKDVEAFKACVARGNSQQWCLRKGDNGVGCWGDDTAQTKTPMCALPPDDMIQRWGSIEERRLKKIPKIAAHRRVVVVVGEHFVVCILADRMPWRKNIRNGAGIDLNPAAAKVLGLKPPFLVPASWTWEDDVA